MGLKIKVLEDGIPAIVLPDDICLFSVSDFRLRKTHRFKYPRFIEDDSEDFSEIFYDSDFDEE